MKSVQDKINQIAKAETRYVIASLMNKLRDLQLCEDSFQDAIISALQHWPKNGVPNSPRAWLITTAHRRALDFLKRGQNFRSKTELIQYEVQLNADENNLKWNDAIENQVSSMPNPHLPPNSEIDDEQLKLIFMCCHPALNKQAQIALSLKIIGGLCTEEIASAFLTNEATMAQRLVRAKQKIKKASIAFKLPATQDLPSRIDIILSTIYFIYNESYVATNSESLTKVNLAEEAIGLCRNVCHFMPNNAESKGLLALILLQLARIDARVDAKGAFVPLEHQDRNLWNINKISEGKQLIITALTMQQIGKYQLLAAINSCHADAKNFAETDWQQIKLLYDQLYKLEPSPIILLNIIVAQRQTDLADMQLQEQMFTKLSLIEAGKKLATYQPLFAVKADFLIRLGRKAEAKKALDKAISLTHNQIEINYLTEKLNNLCLH
ncbi:MAG: sigma-70 family RNA polymerase sigma factor [Alphaproteobacteria bacterium]|nr:sigma-70 family RNA polymerase sigma factor [Alphaproteobacteria bacterium]